jgi:hypothetical protein
MKGKREGEADALSQEFEDARAKDLWRKLHYGMVATILLVLAALRQQHHVIESSYSDW